MTNINLFVVNIQNHSWIIRKVDGTDCRRKEKDIQKIMIKCMKVLFPLFLDNSYLKKGHALIVKVEAA